ncbi:MAG: choice-of-anchor Q domain-containing protein, partial [Thiotrichaceae bacterium]
GLNFGGSSGTLDLLVYNNTFYNTFVDLGSHSSSVNSFEFKNNIIQYSSNQLRSAGAIQSQSNNLLVSSNPGFKDPNNKPTGFVGTYGVNLRPNTDGFSLNTGSSAIDGGTGLANAYNRSINSIPRPQGSAWEIGAYELSATGATTLNPPSNLRMP